jgi:thiamine biosynthesis lipoprotein
MKLRRAQPWLGTLVEIEARHRSTSTLRSALDSAFIAIAQVHRLMSRQLSDSDVTRINAAAAGERVPVHPWTAQTIRRAQRLWQLSSGSFDIVAPPTTAQSRNHARYADECFSVYCSAARRSTWVCKMQPCSISLDGIAKGFAVDQAIHRLRRHGADAGLVNAGGDLRCFGPEAYRVLVRRPDPNGSAPAWQLHVRDCALATSGRYFGNTLWNVNGESTHESWTVVAPTATAADALTKVAFCQAGRSTRLLRRLKAHAWHLTADAGPRLIQDMP